jgi:hypothetical protein
VPELTGGRLLARVFKQAGIGHVFSLCGGHILPIYDGCLGEGERRPRSGGVPEHGDDLDGDLS